MQWRYEDATKTIRSVPENYWIATLDSWDGAVDHQASARLIAAAPELLGAATAALEFLQREYNDNHINQRLRAAIAKATP